MPSIRTLVRTLVWLAVLVAVPALPGKAEAEAVTAPEAGAQAPSPRLLAEASWHGRPIQRPFARRANAADRAPSLTPGTGFRRPGGSRRVRDVQRRLIRLGYRPGSSDGLFGPRTQAAVLAFQRKHGLEQTGSVGTATLDVLRRRTGQAGTGSRPPEPEPPVQAQSEPRPPQAPPVEPAQASDDGPPSTALLLLGLLLVLPLVLLAGLLLRSRRTPAAEGPPAGPPALPERAPQSIPEPAPLPEPEPAPVPSADIPRVRSTPPPRAPHGPPAERRAALRERILRMRADGMTLQEIADLLTEEGEVTLGGARRWQPWSVRAATRPATPQGRHPAHGHRR